MYYGVHDRVCHFFHCDSTYLGCGQTATHCLGNHSAVRRNLDVILFYTPLRGWIAGLHEDLLAREYEFPGWTLGAIGVCNAGAHSVGPLPLLTWPVSNAHLVLNFFRFSTRGGGSETARATLSALGVCFGVTLGLGPFTLLACAV